MPDVPPDQLTFACPRCHTQTIDTFYGPCESCRDQLRATLGGESRDCQEAAYEPKLNVTPNAVALKD